jgi:hypothetical protein
MICLIYDRRLFFLSISCIALILSVKNKTNYIPSNIRFNHKCNDLRFYFYLHIMNTLNSFNIYSLERKKNCFYFIYRFEITENLRVPTIGAIDI